MGNLCTVDLQTKAEVNEVLSRFCFHLDHDEAAKWSQLFTCDAVVDSTCFGTSTGRSAIALIPEMIARDGGGLWRHVLSNVIFERTGSTKELRVRAYCLTTDWSSGGQFIHCADMTVTLQNRGHWQIAHLSMAEVGRQLAAGSLGARAESPAQVATLN